MTIRGSVRWQGSTEISDWNLRIQIRLSSITPEQNTIFRMNRSSMDFYSKALIQCNKINSSSLSSFTSIPYGRGYSFSVIFFLNSFYTELNIHHKFSKTIGKMEGPSHREIITVEGWCGCPDLFLALYTVGIYIFTCI